jgi:hypothetical protein
MAEDDDMAFCSCRKALKDSWVRVGWSVEIWMVGVQLPRTAWSLQCGEGRLLLRLLLFLMPALVLWMLRLSLLVLLLAMGCRLFMSPGAEAVAWWW